MAVALEEWLRLIDAEYLGDFVGGGGAAVRFAVADEAGRAALAAAAVRQAATHGLVLVALDSAEIRLHLMQDLFFAIARRIDWRAGAQRFVEGLFRQQGYRWPRTGEAVALDEIAELHRIDAILLRRELNGWLSSRLMADAGMAQDFRLAALQLCLDRLAPAGDAEAAPVEQWLRGELRSLSPLKTAGIHARITRHNARAMLRSLCRWLAAAGHRGLYLTIDIRQLTRPGAAAAGEVRYTPGAAMDAYEVLRQLIDDADLLERFFLVVVADHAFIDGDPRRSIEAYAALKMRLWDDVRARAHDNPLAPLVVIEACRQP